MQTTFPIHPPKKQSFIEKTRNQIPAFVIFVNAGGKIQDDDF